MAQRLEELESDGLGGDTIVFSYGGNGKRLPRGSRMPYAAGLRVPLRVRVRRAERGPKDVPAPARTPPPGSVRGSFDLGGGGGVESAASRIAGGARHPKARVLSRRNGLSLPRPEPAGMRRPPLNCPGQHPRLHRQFPAATIARGRRIRREHQKRYLRPNCASRPPPPPRIVPNAAEPTLALGKPKFG